MCIGHTCLKNIVSLGNFQFFLQLAAYNLDNLLLKIKIDNPIIISGIMTDHELNMIIQIQHHSLKYFDV